MSLSRADVEAALKRVMLPDGRDILAHDLVRALTIEGMDVRFVIEAPDADAARQMKQEMGEWSCGQAAFTEAWRASQAAGRADQTGRRPQHSRHRIGQGWRG